MKTSKSLTPLSLNQKRRPRPSRVKTAPSLPATPAQRLQLALELSGFCLALHDARKRRR